MVFLFVPRSTSHLGKMGQIRVWGQMLLKALGHRKEALSQVSGYNTRMVLGCPASYSSIGNGMPRVLSRLIWIVNKFFGACIVHRRRPRVVPKSLRQNMTATFGETRTQSGRDSCSSVSNYCSSERCFLWGGAFPSFCAVFQLSTPERS